MSSFKEKEKKTNEQDKKLFYRKMYHVSWHRTIQSRNELDQSNPLPWLLNQSYFLTARHENVSKNGVFMYARLTWPTKLMLYALARTHMDWNVVWLCPVGKQCNSYNIYVARM